MTQQEYYGTDEYTPEDDRIIAAWAARARRAAARETESATLGAEDCPEYLCREESR